MTRGHFRRVFRAGAENGEIRVCVCVCRLVPVFRAGAENVEIRVCVCRLVDIRVCVWIARGGYPTTAQK